jgi:hypothetical protein
MHGRRRGFARHGEAPWCDESGDGDEMKNEAMNEAEGSITSR